MKLNEVKYQFLLSRQQYGIVWMKIRQSKFGKLKNKKLLLLTIYRDLKFDECNLPQLKEATRKLEATHSKIIGEWT